MPVVKCLNAPVTNRKEGVTLWHNGDEAKISEVSGFWQGMIDTKRVVLIKAQPEAVDNTPKKIKKRGRPHAR
jgi:hypothetical protein